MQCACARSELWQTDGMINDRVVRMFQAAQSVSTPPTAMAAVQYVLQNVTVLKSIFLEQFLQCH